MKLIPREYALLTQEQEIELCQQVKKELQKHKVKMTVWEKKLRSLEASGISDQEMREFLATRPRMEGEAYHLLVLHNLRLALRFAVGLQKHGADLEDLFQEAVIGLTKAVELFDLSRGVRFGTYATWWVRQYICRYIEDTKSTIRLPTSFQNLRNSYRRIRNEYFMKHGKEPTYQYLKKRIARLSLSQYEVMVRMEGAATLRLDGASKKDVAEGKQGDFWSQVADPTLEPADSPMLLEEDKEYLRGLLKFLPPKQLQVLQLRYGLVGTREPATLQEVGDMLGISKERVRQLERMALDRLRNLARKTKRGIHEMQEQA